MFERFKTDQSGATATLFALAVVPLMGMVGAAVDYSRASAEHSKLQSATDAVVLALVKEPRTATASQLQAKAKAAFGAVYKPGAGVTVSAPTVERQDNAIVLSARGAITNAFMQVVGLRDVALGTESRAAWGTERIELALVLDNTGSMDDLIGGQRKIDVLIGAARTLLKDAQALADRPDAIKVSVVPFDTEVRLDAGAHRYKSWYRPLNGMTPASWTGYVVDRFGAFATSDAPIDDTPASRYPALPETGHKTVPGLMALSKNHLPAMRPLTSLYDSKGFTDTDDLIKAMKPRGYTNIALGVTWGLSTLSRSEPFSEGAAFSDTSVKRYMIVLTDGLNTAYHKDGVLQNAEWEKANRNWSRAQRIEAEMDATTTAACTNAKANVEVFTVRLLQGNESLLRGCASPPNDRIDQHYFDVQSPPQLSAAFREILNAIGGTRLTH